MKRLGGVALFLLLCINLFAQDSLGNLKELQQLLQLRQQQFQSYAAAADQRSGIFGNKTKKDLEESREILLRIVEIDNRIMVELDQAIAERGMAKADFSADQMNYEKTIRQLTMAADTLEKQVGALRAEQGRRTKQWQNQKIISGLFGLLLGFGIGAWLLVGRRKKQEA
jgi:hypothetical protein